MVDPVGFTASVITRFVEQKNKSKKRQIYIHPMSLQIWSTIEPESVLEWIVKISPNMDTQCRFNVGQQSGQQYTTIVITDF